MTRIEFKTKLIQLNITQKEFAFIVGVTDQTVTNWNAKETYPKWVSDFIAHQFTKKGL